MKKRNYLISLVGLLALVGCGNNTPSATETNTEIPQSINVPESTTPEKPTEPGSTEEKPSEETTAPVEIVAQITNKIDFKNLTPSSPAMKLEVSITPEGTPYEFRNDNPNVTSVSEDGTVTFLAPGKSIIELVVDGVTYDDIHIRVWEDKVVNSIADLKTADVLEGYYIQGKVVSVGETDSFAMVDNTGSVLIKKGGFMATMVQEGSFYEINGTLKEYNGNRYLTDLNEVSSLEAFPVSEPVAFDGAKLDTIDLTLAQYVTVEGVASVERNRVTLTIEGTQKTVYLGYVEEGAFGLSEAIQNGYKVKATGVIGDYEYDSTTMLHMYVESLQIVEKVTQSLVIANKEDFNNITVGDADKKLEIVTEPKDLQYTIVSDNQKVVEVKENGILAFLAAGEANIVVSAGNLSDTLHIVVKEKATAQFETIADVKKSPEDTTHKMKVKMLGFNSDESMAYVGDASGSIGVYARDHSQLQVGKSYELTATLSSYEGNLQLIDYTAVAIEENVEALAQIADATNIESLVGQYISVEVKYTPSSMSGFFTIGEDEFAFNSVSFFVQWGDYGLEAEPAENTALILTGVMEDSGFGIGMNIFNITLK